MYLAARAEQTITTDVILQDLAYQTQVLGSFTHIPSY